MKSKKVGLLVEGSDDQAFFVPLIKRVLPCEVETLRKGRCVIGIGQNLRSPLKTFLEMKCTHVLICADNHNISPGVRRSIINDAEQLAVEIIPSCQFYVAVAVQGLEAWIIPHFTMLNKVFALSLDPPKRAERHRDPKGELSRLIQRDPTFDDWTLFAQNINIIPENEKVESYRALLEKLVEWKS